MLLNLSNHPSSSWPEKQIQEANRLFGDIRDMPFPHIDPEASEEDIQRLSEVYKEDILAMRPQAVHIMGELTFCFQLVFKLRQVGIPCLASTTHRTTEDLPNGTKISKFEFVRFRKYDL
ncbi:CRISPR-associated protein [Algoriphagus kandeliae]|uniref:CRISPR-associated protein n=1 Tax=Algoriphagus kandeliae TaxID=2562278 RepID=A0A4Y9QS66_9BACT|nr:CRISPR-associated protein [Algoriphagus kandeliae]TFV94472.1 CRISPR-associated protein [Algoriphagus kandeliae]